MARGGHDPQSIRDGTRVARNGEGCRDRELGEFRTFRRRKNRRVKKRADVLNFHSTTQCTARPPRALRAWSTRLVGQAHSKDFSVYSPRRRLEMRCAVAPFGTRCVVTESESSFASFTPNAGSNRSNRRARCRAVRPTSRVACFTTHATRSHLRGVVRGTHKPSRVRVCLAPCAVATPLSDDLSTTIENEGAFGRGAEESSARSVDVVIKDTVSVDGTQDVPEDMGEVCIINER